MYKRLLINVSNCQSKVLPKIPSIKDPKLNRKCKITEIKNNQGLRLGLTTMITLLKFDLIITFPVPVTMVFFIG